MYPFESGQGPVEGPESVGLGSGFAAASEGLSVTVTVSVGVGSPSAAHEVRSIPDIAVTERSVFRTTASFASSRVLGVCHLRRRDVGARIGGNQSR